MFQQDIKIVFTMFFFLFFFKVSNREYLQRVIARYITKKTFQIIMFKYYTTSFSTKQLFFKLNIYLLKRKKDWLDRHINKAEKYFDILQME